MPFKITENETRESMEKDFITEANILFISPDAKIKEYTDNLLRGEGYTVDSCENYDAFLETLRQKKNFDLIVADLGTKFIDGIKLCKLIRNDFMLRHIPIIILTSKGNTIEKIKGIYAGADDYVEKPLQAGELLTRIKASLWRTARDLDANPVSKLPGNASILKELKKRINEKRTFSVAYADLDNFKGYNDHYGFNSGDKLIKHVASLINDIIRDYGSESDFLGHIGGDDFLFIINPEETDDICKRIIERFDNSIPQFYKKKDIIKKCIMVKNRKGILSKIPLITISIGITNTRHRQITHTGQIIQIATELKLFAKTFSKSIYITDRRKDFDTSRI